jgi:hypothetical protein
MEKQPPDNLIIGVELRSIFLKERPIILTAAVGLDIFTSCPGARATSIRDILLISANFSGARATEKSGFELISPHRWIKAGIGT